MLVRDPRGHEPNTISTLGRSELRLEDLDQMAAVTEEELCRWVVYGGWVQNTDSTVDVYAGVHVAAEGSSECLGQNYEKAL